MRKLKRLAIVTVLGLGMCGLALAQDHQAGAKDRDAAPNHGDAASMVKHFAEFFPQIAAFDKNKDGKLDEAETAALKKAIAEGTLKLPDHTPPQGGKPDAEMMASHIAEMFARVARYDANHDGQLDEKEQAALKSAIEKGELFPHGQHPPEGGTQH
jgi:anti-sigma28 factor (negative regulator of flagellin synthesis)